MHDDVGAVKHLTSFGDGVFLSLVD